MPRKPCIHHWKIATVAVDQLFPGVCTKCRKKRTFAANAATDTRHSPLQSKEIRDAWAAEMKVFGRWGLR